MATIIVGTRAPVRTKLSRRFDPIKGLVITQEYESAGDNLYGLALEAQNSGMDYTHDANQSRSRLVLSATGAAAGFPEQTTITWQLFTNEEQKDIRESPLAIALGPVVVKQIRLAIQMMEVTAEQGEDIDPLLDGIEQTYADFTADDGPFPPDSNAKALLDLMLHGATSFAIFGYSARQTVSLPYLYAGAVPSLAPDSLVAGLIAAIPVGGANDGFLYEWGWRRRGSSRTFSGNNRTEISIEWALSSWSKKLYSDITDLPT